MNMLEKIEAQLAALSKAEQKVARQILADPQAAMHAIQPLHTGWRCLRQ